MAQSCPNCSALVMADDRHCGACGRKLADAQVKATKTPKLTARASDNFALVALALAGVLMIGVGAYQVLQEHGANREQAASTQRPVPVRPEPPAAAPEPKPRQAVRTPPPPPSLGCGNLIASGEKLVCDGFEPSWSVKFRCRQSRLTTSFTDFFSSAELLTIPGTATLQSQDPWVFRTSQGLVGTVVATPGGCRDSSEQAAHFTLMPKVVPRLARPESICCRIVR